MRTNLRMVFLATLLLGVLLIVTVSITDTLATAQNANSSTTDAGERQETSGGEQADLSGTYKGRITMTGAHELAGEATLSITGGTFTLESGGTTHKGRVSAVTTRGYTGASFFFTDIQDSSTSTPLAVSVRARKAGTRLTLTPVPGSKNRMSFNGRSE